MIIHMGWVGGDAPRHVLESVEAVRAVAAGCDVLFHADESDVPDRWKPSTFGYSLIPHIGSDIQRHAVLMKHGGLWLDADVKVMRSPAEWAAEWRNYTAVKLNNRGPLIGTDIIYAERLWGGWGWIDDYISSLVASKPKRLSVLAFAHDMIAEGIRSSGAMFDIAEPRDVFPYDRRHFSDRSVVARGYMPPDSRPGLGDMIAAGLDAVGITKERVSKAVGGDCGCKKRQEALNTIGRRIGIG